METDTLQFYAFSADRPAGQGTGEHVQDPTKYNELNNIRHWRRMFSSLWANDPFIYKNRTFKSHEHTYQASKYFANNMINVFNEFSIESNTELSKMNPVKLPKRYINLTAEQIRIFEQQKNELKDEIYKAKYTINSGPGKALIATKNANLINYGRRIKKIRNVRLERIRDELIKAC